MTPPRFGRRTLLGGAAAVGAATALGPAVRLLAAPAPGDRRFVAFFLNGGWDLLLGPDARDPARTYSGIDLGTSLLEPRFRDPIAVSLGGREVLWGAPMRSLARHADVLTLFNGINMNTVAHPTGRAYVNTFRPPSGAVPRGDSLGTLMATVPNEGETILPNISIGVPTRNESFDPAFTGIRTGRAPEVVDLLRPIAPVFPNELQLLLEATQDRLDPCVAPGYTGPSPADDLLLARDRVRKLLAGGLEDEFNLAADDRLMSAYGITNPRNGGDPGVVAATVEKLLVTGLSHSVTAQLQAGLDTHGPEWAASQPVLLESAFDALGVFLARIRETDPDLARTTVAVFSEFSRTPRLNGVQGRDHWFASSVLVFGGALRRGVVGATREDTLGLVEIDVVSGRPMTRGQVLLPEDVGATLAAAAGLDPSPFRATVLDAWIEGSAA
jgi:uncharacterized protein (DUF1501 family)